MEVASNKKEFIVLRIYSILILIYAVFDILIVILPKFQVITIKLNIDLISQFFVLTGIALYSTPINLIVGYGLLRRRFWARYGVIAVMLTIFPYLLGQYLYLGKFSLRWDSVIIQPFFVGLTLFYFTRTRVKALFGETHPFRFISWHGLLVVAIVLLSFWWIMFLLYLKLHVVWRFGYPFFTDKPQLITLKKPESPELLAKYRRVKLLDTSLLIPKEFSMRRLVRVERSAKWTISLQNQGQNTKGVIIFGNSFPYEEFFPDEQIKKLLGHASRFDTEKYILTNDWNPGLIAVRSIMRPKGGEAFNIKEIRTDGLRGFLKGWQKGDAFFREFSVYNEEDTQCIAGTIMSIKGYFNENDILTILSSIEFLKPEELHRAQDHYENGLKSYTKGDALQTQFEFANAYVLSPENPDYVFMFAKSLLLKDPKNYDHVKNLLNHALKIKPDHKDARRLLKEVESKLSKETKSN